MSDGRAVAEQPFLRIIARTRRLDIPGGVYEIDASRRKNYPHKLRREAMSELFAKLGEHGGIGMRLDLKLDRLAEYPQIV